MTEENNLVMERLKKLESIRAMKVDPFGGRFVKEGLVCSFVEHFEEKKLAKTAGRLSAVRVMGKSTFCDLRDESGRIQLYVKHDHLSAEQQKLFENLDIGDILGVEGTLSKNLPRPARRQGSQKTV